MTFAAGLVLLVWGLFWAVSGPLLIGFGRAWNPSIPTYLPAAVGIGGIAAGVAGLMAMTGSRIGRWFALGIALGGGAIGIRQALPHGPGDASFLLGWVTMAIPPAVAALLLLVDIAARRRP